MSEEIIKVLDALGEKFGIAVDWSQQNVMPYIQELMGKYIRYEIATSVAWIVLMFVLTGACIAGALLTKRYADKHNVDLDSPDYFSSWFFMGCVVCAIIFGFIFVLVAAFQIFDIVTCLTFPEKMVFEFLKTLAK